MIIRRSRISALIVTASLTTGAGWLFASEEATIQASIGAEASALRLNLERFNKVLKADENLARALKDQPALRETLKMNPGKESVADWTRRVEAQPPLASAFREAGLTPREYLQTVTALLEASAAADSKRAGGAKEASSLVPPENVAFIEQNRAAVAGWQKPGSAGNKVNTLEDFYVAEEPATGKDAKPQAKAPR